MRFVGGAGGSASGCLNPLVTVLAAHRLPYCPQCAEREFGQESPEQSQGLRLASAEMVVNRGHARLSTC